MKQTAALALAIFFVFLFQASLEYSAEAQGGNPALARQIKQGERTYRLQCQACHGKGGDHPDKMFNLVDNEWKHGDSLQDIKKTVVEGVRGTAMQSFRGRLTPKKIDSVARFVYSLREKKK